MSQEFISNDRPHSSSPSITYHQVLYEPIDLIHDYFLMPSILVHESSLLGLAKVDPTR